MTAGFVLGEVLGLLGIRISTMAVIMITALVLLTLSWSRMNAISSGQRDTRRLSDENRLRRRAMAVRIALGVIFLAFGFGRGHKAFKWSEEEQKLELDNKDISLWGTVADVRQSGDYYVSVLKDCKVIENGQKGGHKDIKRIQVYLEQMDEMPAQGDKIQIKGKANLIQGARNPGEFDYRLYYQAQGIHYRVFSISWERTRHAGLYPGNILSWWADSAGKILDQIAVPKYAGIFRAAILGDKSGLDEDIRDLYQKNGIAHLLAISGLHLSLIGGVVYRLLRRMGAGYGLAGLAAGALLAAYAVATGASPSAVRAWLMALCGYLAAYMGRSYDLLSALGLAGLLILWDNPYRIYQAGVQLSFGAAAGIGIVSEYQSSGWEKEQKGTGSSPEPIKRCQALGKQAGSVLAISLGMQLVTLPVVLYHFFQIPVYGIFLNLMVVPLMGIVVASGCGGILLGSIFLPAGRFAVGAGHVILRFYEFLCRIWEAIPGSILIVGRPNGWQTVIYYGILAAAAGLWKRGKRCFSVVVLMLAPLFLMHLPASGMEVCFLDVGQGDGICIRTGRGTILVDGGSTDQKQLGKNRLEPFLKSQGVSRVDCAIVSHGDQDHISGLMYLMEESDILIENLVLPGMGKGQEIYERLSQAAAAQGGTVYWMARGDRLKWGRLAIFCLYPESGSSKEKEAGKKEEDRNEHSLALQVSYGDFHMLLTGDMSGKGEQRLLELEREERRKEEKETIPMKQTQVLKVAHHGSSYSTTKEWLDEISPVWAVISYGQGNRYGHPGEKVLKLLEERKIETFQTGQSGAVRLWTNGKRILWRQWIP